jgi:UDP-N-acetylmuramoyl-L-alanyl-D-glutamate--2,6-diaminopimelate ligase
LTHLHLHLRSALRRLRASCQSCILGLDGTSTKLVPSALSERLGGELKTRLVGAVFAENALAAALVGLHLGYTTPQINSGLLGLERVPGRFEIVATEPIIVVDYAHTPDALVRTCAAARELVNSQSTDGRVIAVFGAGGNRDTSKREPMGKAVGSMVDIAIVTSDNPRHEDPTAIANTVANGCRLAGKAKLLVEIDRRHAIERAIERARPNDIVLIFGKGHETGQEMRGTTLPFDDACVAREILG